MRYLWERNENGAKVAIEAQVIEFEDIFGEPPKIKNIGVHDICLECSDKIKD